jgi:hypothetical protein
MGSHLIIRQRRKKIGSSRIGKRFEGYLRIFEKALFVGTFQTLSFVPHCTVLLSFLKVSKITRVIRVFLSVRQRKKNVLYSWILQAYLASELRILVCVDFPDALCHPVHLSYSWVHLM